MDIFPRMLGETEFRNFTAEDYAALAGVLDDVTAKYICDYCSNPNADAALVETIQNHLQATLTAFTFHLELKSNGIIDLVKSLAPESLPYATDMNLDELIEKLSYLEEHQNDIKATIPARNRQSYALFKSCISEVIMRERMKGITPTYPDIEKRIDANKFLFYQSGEKEHTTGVGVLNSKKRQWTLVLNGAKWLKYCKEHNLPYDLRSAF